MGLANFETGVTYFKKKVLGYILEVISYKNCSKLEDFALECARIHYSKYEAA